MDKKQLEKLYKKYNRREFVSPDPLQFLYDYKDIGDREIVALIASSLAYGRVKQILKSVEIILNKMGNSPREYLLCSTEKRIRKICRGFVHRFTNESDIAELLIGIKKAIEEYGSLNNLFLDGYNLTDENILSASEKFVDYLMSDSYLLASPKRGSACKRLNLFLRWMIRSDDVDLGGWIGILPSELIIPLDTHMYKIGRKLGYTKRKQANLKTAVEITKAFADKNPEDPVKYDFALTRLGIRDDANYNELLV